MFHFESRKSTIISDTTIKTQNLLTCLSNFNFIFTPVITRKVFDFTYSVNVLVQVKSNDIVNGIVSRGSLMDLISNLRVKGDNYHQEWYSKTCHLAQKSDVNQSVLRRCARQTTRYTFTPESSRCYKLPSSVPVIDTVLKELKRRFKGSQKACMKSIDYGYRIKEH